MRDGRLLPSATILLAFLFACDTGATRSADKPGDKQTAAAGAGSEAPAKTKNPGAPELKPTPDAAGPYVPPAETGRSKTARDFFLLLPQDYFGVECCDGDIRGYLKKYLLVEDTANGYLEGDGDGAQPGFKMALFKRPEGTYLIGLETFGEGLHENYFLEYKNGRWLDVGARVVPGYSRNNFYVIPRYGTTVKVFNRKFPEPELPEVSEKGEKRLYDLVWKDGRFTIRR